MERFIGKKLDGRYEISEVLGVGGMAVVFKAYDAIEQRTVAVKILKQEFLSNEEFKRRFKNESKAIAMLSHPNIVKVYDVSLTDNLQYIVMEYIDGITLKEYIEQQKVLSWKETVHFTVQILRAMQHAHDKGIVHRDLKPQNIMLLQNGAIKVTDFGIARFSRSETRTITDKAIGSVHYISPEQARGGYIDEKADIYSVGVMMYEMLTGRLPFEADSPVSVAIMQMQADPKMPREINESIPEGLEQITKKAMQKDPALRYQSAAEMLRDIEEFKKNPSIQFEYKYFGEEPKAKYVDAINQVKNTPEYENYDKRRSPVIPILSAIAAAFVLIMVGVGIWLADMFGVIDLDAIFHSDTSSTITSIEAQDLIGMPLEEALALPTIGEMIVVEAEQYSSDYAKDVIIDQNPKSPVRVNITDKIRVTISLGPRTKAVPDLKNSTQADAELKLRNEEFYNYTFVQESSDDVPEGRVIRSEPAEFTQAAVDSLITVYISAGPKIKNVTITETFVGLTQEEAEQMLETLGLVPVIEQEDSSLTKGLVTRASVNVGDVVQVGSSVTLYVSTGESPQKSATIGLDLRGFDRSQYPSVQVGCFVDNKQTESSAYTTGTVVNFTFDGNASDTRVEFVVTTSDGQTYIQDWTIDFTTETPTITKVSDNLPVA